MTAELVYAPDVMQCSFMPQTVRSCWKLQYVSIFVPGKIFQALKMTCRLGRQESRLEANMTTGLVLPVAC